MNLIWKLEMKELSFSKLILCFRKWINLLWEFLFLLRNLCGFKPRVLTETQLTLIRKSMTS
ncbi:hypothetical protein CsatB_026946 [Cannabis sativa]